MKKGLIIGGVAVVACGGIGLYFYEKKLRKEAEAEQQRTENTEEEFPEDYTEVNMEDLPEEITEEVQDLPDAVEVDEENLVTKLTEEELAALNKPEPNAFEAFNQVQEAKAKASKAADTKEAKEESLVNQAELTEEEKDALQEVADAVADAGNIKKEPIFSVTADAFIVPNKIGTISSLYNPEQYKELCRLNGIEPVDDTKLIELWYTNEEELDSENLGDHGFTVNGQDYRLVGSFMPAELFKGKKEGDTVVVKMFVSEVRPNKKEVAEFKLKLNQHGYKYRNHGNFEKVLKEVTR